MVPGQIWYYYHQTRTGSTKAFQVHLLGPSRNAETRFNPWLGDPEEEWQNPLQYLPENHIWEESVWSACPAAAKSQKVGERAGFGLFWGGGRLACEYRIDINASSTTAQTAYEWESYCVPKVTTKRGYMGNLHRQWLEYRIKPLPSGEKKYSTTLVPVDSGCSDAPFSTFVLLTLSWVWFIQISYHVDDNDPFVCLLPVGLLGSDGERMNLQQNVRKASFSEQPVLLYSL